MGTNGSVGSGPSGGIASNATAVNNLGEVVGWTNMPTQGQMQAFVGDVHNVIGTLGGISSEATGINDHGLVVGWSNVANPQYPNSPGPTHAFLYGPDGKMNDLGVLPGYQNSGAASINSLGQIVGSATNNLTDLGRAVLFEDGKVIDLNSLLPANSGWLLQDATAINDSGQVLGWGTYNGTSESFLLNLETVPEPTTVLLFGVMAAVGVARTVRRQR